MKRNEMIKKKERFNFMIKKGKYIKDKYFVIYYSSSEKENKTSFGIAIKSSLGKAVIRNRLKRQVRAIIDKNKKLFPNGRDYIIMIRNECLNADFSVMDESLNVLLKGIK